MTNVANVPASLQLGARVPSFKPAASVDGKVYGLADFADKRALVLIFDSNRCPTAKAYVARMIALQQEYGARGVQLLAVNSTNPYLYAEESYDAMVARARDSGFNFPYLKDEDQSLAKTFGATCTFHVFVLDDDRRLRYRGRFDDSRNPERVTSHDLRNALDDVLAGREVRVPETDAFGCALDLDEGVSGEEVAMAKDPICGMDVDPAKPPGGKSDYRGTTYYFCGPGCKETFDKDPARHAAAA